MDDTLDPEARFAAIIATADSRDTKLWAILTLLEDLLRLPAGARVAGERVELTHVEYAGDDQQGLIATVRDERGARTLPLAEIIVVSRETGAGVVRLYADWARGRAVDAVARAGAPAGPARDDVPVRLAILAVTGRTARARRLDDHADVVYRPREHEVVVPGTIISLAPKRPERDDSPRGRAEGPTPVSGILLEGEVVAITVDARHLELVPATLEVEEDGVIHRLPADPESDLLEESELLAEGGDPRGARRLLLEVLAEHPGHIDAHRRLGEIALATDPQLALTHFAVGAAIGDLAVPDPLDGLLPGDLAANRPYLACLYGCGRALHRLGRDEDARAPLQRLLALDPDDHFGGRQLLVAVGGRPRPDA